MTFLLDVNVLIALAWPNHTHHAAVRAWFRQWGRHGWATCPLTEAGFVRVSCNPLAVKHTVTPLDAIEVLERLVQLGSHEFWSLDQSIRRLPESIGIRLQGYRQISDAVLLAAAIQRGGRLATLDARMAALLPENERAFLHIIPG